MGDFKTDPEQSLPQDWRDILWRRAGTRARFVADVIELAFGEDWEGSSRPSDLVLETTQVFGSKHEKGYNDIAWSSPVKPECQDGSSGGERIHVVIEVQWTVDLAMPFRVMVYEGMRSQQLQEGQKPVPRIVTIVLYTGEEAWHAKLDAGETYARVRVKTLPRVPYDLVDLQRLEAGPGTKNVVALLGAVMRGEKTLEAFTRAADALAERLAELGDTLLEVDLFALVRAQGKEDWPGLDWSLCGDLVGLVRLLKEEKVTWPEKWMTHERPNWREEEGAKLRPEVLKELRIKERPRVLKELRTEERPKVREEVRNEVRPEVREEVRNEVRPEVVAEVRQEIEARLEAELRSVVEARLEAKLRSELEARVRAEHRGKIRADGRGD